MIIWIPTDTIVLAVVTLTWQPWLVWPLLAAIKNNRPQCRYTLPLSEPGLYVWMHAIVGGEGVCFAGKWISFCHSVGARVLAKKSAWKEGWGRREGDCKDDKAEGVCENATSAFYRSGQFITVVFLVSKLHLQHHFFLSNCCCKDVSTLSSGQCWRATKCICLVSLEY